MTRQEFYITDEEMRACFDKKIHEWKGQLSTFL